MRKHILRLLAQHTIQAGEINQTTFGLLMQRLSKKELKLFLFFLRKYIQENRVMVQTSLTPSRSLKTQIKKLFPSKEVLFQNNPSLGAGIMVQNNDTILEISIKGYIERIISEAKKGI